MGGVNNPPASVVSAFAAPAFTIGESNVEGVATTAVRSDATIAVLDAVAPTTQDYSDVAAAGSAAAAPHRDHLHGMPAAGAIVVSIVKAADETVTSSTTLQNDDDFSFSVDANSEYLVVMHIACRGLENGGLKAAWSLPAGATVKWSSIGAVANSGVATSVVTTARQAGTADIVTAAASLGIQYIILAAAITVAGTAGTAQWQWAQQASDATGSVIEVDSMLIAQKK